MDIKVDSSNNIVKYPYTIGDLRADHPSTSFPVNAMSQDNIRDFNNILTVHPVERPVDTEATWYQAGPPVWSGSQWNLSWVAHDYTAEEITQNHLANVRQLRRNEYDSPEDQLEFITENGLEAWQAKVAEIKAKYPKE
tara:strand:- start:372 stop:785 length:414 start_codon:yes stop_codon:yes gene_type:complete